MPRELAKVTPQEEYSAEGDFALVNRLLKNPRYNIPEHLRSKMVRSAEEVLDYSESDVTKVQAIKVLNELDKRNIELVKMAMPKQHIHRPAKEMTDAEIIEVIQQTAEQMKVAGIKAQLTNE